jgi:hypothetical protein
MQNYVDLDYLNTIFLRMFGCGNWIRIEFYESSPSSAEVKKE